MSLSINKDSFNSIFPFPQPIDTYPSGHAQVMVYGLGSCKYEDVQYALKYQNDTPVKKVLTYRVGGDENAAKMHNQDKTLEGRVIEQLEVNMKPENRKQLPQQCKTAIVNLMLENYKRKQDNLPIIPFLFCYDIEGGKGITNPANIATRKRPWNNLISNKELRRCYKLCCEITEDSNSKLKAIEEIAKESIKFVKLKKDGTNNYKLELLTPFWENDAWKTEWPERKMTKKPVDPNKTLFWRNQLLQKMNNSENQ